MSENTTENTGTTPDVEAPEAPAQETDWKAEARKWEQRAKENRAQAKELESKAARLDEIEEASQSEAQKLQRRAEKAEQAAAEASAQLIRYQVAQAKGVPADLLTGSTVEELEAAADRLIEFRGEQKSAPSSPSLGKVNNKPVKGTTADTFADFFSTHI